jgi:hypothetical protein
MLVSIFDLTVLEEPMWKRGIVATGLLALVVACTGGNSASEDGAVEEELLPVPRAGGATVAGVVKFAGAYAP